MGADQSQLEPLASNVSPETMADMKHLVEKEVFDAKTIANYYKVFMKQHPTGKLKMDEFIHLYEKCFPEGNHSRKFAEHLFNSFDTDHDHELDFREVMMITGLLWERDHENQIEWSFKMFDTKGEGYITRQDCRDIEKIWLDQAGRFDQREVNARAADAVRSIFKQFDENRDGKITKEEFMRAVAKEHKGYLQMGFDERYAYDLMNLMGGKRINPMQKMVEEGTKK